MTKQDSYGEFEAYSLYCPKCKQAMPVRKRLLLVLPDGNKYEYLCSRCATSLGMKKDDNTKDFKILLKG
jgi:hypothetical protein